MDIIEVFKVLSNDKRLQILFWLKEPEEHFTASNAEEAILKGEGVCVSLIQEKLKVTQSTASQYLSMLQRVGLLEATRIGKWTYYKRDEVAIKEICNFIAKEI